MPYGSGKRGTLKANDFSWNTTQYTGKSRSNKNCWSRVITDYSRDGAYQRTELYKNRGARGSKWRRRKRYDESNPQTELCQYFGSQENWPKMWLSSAWMLPPNWLTFSLMLNKHRTTVPSKRWSNHLALPILGIRDICYINQNSRYLNIRHPIGCFSRAKIVTTSIKGDPMSN